MTSTKHRMTDHEFAPSTAHSVDPITTTTPLIVAGPSTGSFSLSFLIFDTLHSTRSHAALVHCPRFQELGRPDPVYRDTHSSPQSCPGSLPAPAVPPGTRHLQPDARQHREAMGGHAASGAGRSVDDAEGPHEDRLEGIDHAGEEGWCVQFCRARLGVATARMTYLVLWSRYPG
jgi:hypothetical protein